MMLISLTNRLRWSLSQKVQIDSRMFQLEKDGGNDQLQEVQNLGMNLRMRQFSGTVF